MNSKNYDGVNKSQQMDPAQQAMQKSGAFMPVMIMATFVFIPIPAGVHYISDFKQCGSVVQTVVINKQLGLRRCKKETEN